MEDKQENLEHASKLSSEEMKLLVIMGRALADPTRIRILGLLAERPMYGQELAQVLDVKPPTVSHHIAPLEMAGLVRMRRENNYHYYELDGEGIEHLAESTQHIAVRDAPEVVPATCRERFRRYPGFAGSLRPGT